MFRDDPNVLVGFRKPSRCRLLLVGINEGNPPPALGEPHGQVRSNRRLPDASLLIHNRDDHVQTMTRDEQERKPLCWQARMHASLYAKKHLRVSASIVWWRRLV